MKYFTTTSNASRHAADCVVVGVYERGKLTAAAAEIDSTSRGHIKKLLKTGDVSGRLGHWTVLTGLARVKATRVVVVGLGKSSTFGVTQFRKAVEAATRSVADTKTRKILNCLTNEPVKSASPYYRARHSVETIRNTLYRFNEMKSGRKSANMPLTAIGHSIGERTDAESSMRGAAHADAIVAGVTLAKDLGNRPSNVCTPSHLAQTAKQLASGNAKVKTKILDEAGMKRLGMGSLLSVTAGSVEAAKLIVIEYNGAGTEKPIVLVGKGVTFDTGGISLKPGPSMDEMKYDMCGAASVIGTMAAIIKMDLPINVNVVVPAVENMPSATATKPGDIVTSMSGQTIEVLNTDAEGRLILCDALTYSRQFKPAAVIDVATLTGACVVALGHHRSAIMANDDDLRDELFGAGNSSGDIGWPMPLGEQYNTQLKSNFADMANIGGPGGGSITAGCFLGRFTDGLSWAHLDIAGVAWKSGAQKGATGRPVPLLCEFLLSRAGAQP